jgi:hypothetical protein
MRKFLLVFTGILIVQIASGQNRTGSNFKDLDLAEAFSRKEEVKLSRLVNGISYIKLESTGESVIDGYAQYEVTKDYVIVRQMGPSQKYQILLFDRNTGKFIREIGKAGRGPEEYSIYSPIPYNPVTKEIYAIGNSRNILAYDINGRITRRIVTSVLKDYRVAAFASMIDNETFVAQVLNDTGTEKVKLILLAKDGSIKKIPNTLTYNKLEKVKFYTTPFWGFYNFYIWDNKTNFIELYCDTLYQVTKESMIPRYYFNWGKYNSKYSEQLFLTDYKHFYKNFAVENVFENKSHIFVQANFEENNYLFFVDKATGKVTFCKTLESGVSGFQDDISGLMTVLPQGASPNNELVWIIQPVKLLKWLKENPAAADKAYKKLQWLKDTDEMSNPVVAIANCKN